LILKINDAKTEVKLKKQIHCKKKKKPNEPYQKKEMKKENFSHLLVVLFWILVARGCDLIVNKFP